MTIREVMRRTRRWGDASMAIQAASREFLINQGDPQGPHSGEADCAIFSVSFTECGELAREKSTHSLSRLAQVTQRGMR